MIDSCASFFRRYMKVLGLLAAGAILQGCGLVYKTTGDILVNFSEDEMVPYLMESSDTGMACATGESLTPLLMSFGQAGAHPDKLGVLVNAVAGNCAEKRAVEAELAYLRALEQENVSEAQDARVRQKRYAELAAERQYRSYKLAVGQYGQAENGECPRLRSEFDSLVFMIGQLGGVQALLNDSTAQGAVGVPRNIAAKAEGGAACLDNDQWWGVPQGIRASIWSTLPALKPEGADTWQTLEASVDKGFENGVRLPSALYVISAQGADNSERMRTGIREFANRDFEKNPAYQLLDQVARVQITAVSDLMWTEATGQRTPMGELGTFWDEDGGESNADIDDLL